MKTRIGIVGCGTIGLEVAKAIETRLKNKATLAAIYDVDQIKIDNFLSRIKSVPDICSLKDLIKKSDFVVEAASAAASADIAEKTLAAGKNVLIMSVGGLLKDPAIFNLARKVGANGRSPLLYVPSGALAGLDALKAASLGKINKVTLTTSKSPESLGLSPAKEENVVFEGTAKEAVRKFPKNINVAATLNLLCGVRVRIIAVPGLKTNIHEVEVEGDFGKFLTRTENLPSPNNPKTSYLAALSAIATLESALNNVKVGT